MAISLRLSEPDMELIKAYAKLHGITVSEFARRSMLERIKDESIRCLIYRQSDQAVVQDG